MSDYDRKERKIRLYNEPILAEFESWLAKSGLASKTVKNHSVNIDFFAVYLTYYEPLCKLDEADSSDVFGFLRNWYPRKAMWASKSNTRAYMATFRKFFKYLKESNRIEGNIEEEVRETLKEHKEGFLDAVAFDEEDYGW